MGWGWPADADRTGAAKGVQNVRASVKECRNWWWFALAIFSDGGARWWYDDGVDKRSIRFKICDRVQHFCRQFFKLSRCGRNNKRSKSSFEWKLKHFFSSRSSPSSVYFLSQSQRSPRPKGKCEFHLHFYDFSSSSHSLIASHPPKRQSLDPGRSHATVEGEINLFFWLLFYISKIHELNQISLIYQAQEDERQEEKTIFRFLMMCVLLLTLVNSLLHLSPMLLKWNKICFESGKPI